MLTSYQTKFVERARADKTITAARERIQKAIARERMIDQIIMLSDPPNRLKFREHLEGWKDSALTARLATLQDEAVHEAAPKKTRRITTAPVLAGAMAATFLYHLTRR